MACGQRYTWAVGQGWILRGAAKAQRRQKDSRGSDVAYVVRGYLVSPQSLKEHEPTWDELVDAVRRILGNPLFDFGDLSIAIDGHNQALITDAAGRPLARTSLESPDRVRTVPLDH